MAKKIYFRDDRKVVMGIFRLKSLKGGQQPKRLKLCSYDEYFNYVNGQGKSIKRSSAQRQKFVDDQYNSVSKRLITEEETQKVAEEKGPSIGELTKVWISSKESVRGEIVAFHQREVHFRSHSK